MSSPSIKTSQFEGGLAKLQPVEPHDFLWHLRSPWREHFAHDHWWEKSGAEKSQEAWLWEIFRRQPETLNYFIQLRAEKSPPMLQFWPPPPIVANSCFQSWPQLGKRLRWLWRDYLEGIPPQRGFHPGAVTVLNEYRNELLALKGDGATSLDYIRRLSMVPTYEGRMKSDAIEQDRKGRILLAIDPLSDGAGKQVEKIVKAWRKDKIAVTKGKARHGQWGDIISSFERDELSRPNKKKRENQLFAQYRRIVGGQKPNADGINSD